MNVSFSEIYDNSGDAWICMTVEIAGNPAQNIEFDNIAQVEECAGKILKYLARRNNSPLDGNDISCAAEEEPHYNNSPLDD